MTFQHNKVSGNERIYTSDTITAAGDSEAVARGLWKFEFTVASQKSILEGPERPANVTSFGAEWVVIDQHGKEVDYPLPKDVILQIKDSARNKATHK